MWDLVPMIPDESTDLDWMRCLAAGENFWFSSAIRGAVDVCVAVTTAGVTGVLETVAVAVAEGVGVEEVVEEVV